MVSFCKIIFLSIEIGDTKVYHEARPRFYISITNYFPMVLYKSSCIKTIGKSTITYFFFYKDGGRSSSFQISRQQFILFFLFTKNNVTLLLYNRCLKNKWWLLNKHVKKSSILSMIMITQYTHNIQYIHSSSSSAFYSLFILSSFLILNFSF